MIAAIMQPYFFPYIGYFQLMQAVDMFIFYDDVQYIDRGWVNRNRILIAEKPTWLTLPVHKASRMKTINQRQYLLEEIEAIKNMLHAAYMKAPAFAEIFPYLCSILNFSESNVAMFNANLLRSLALKLGIRCNFAMSSEINKPTNLRGEAKIIDLCQRIGAKKYVNPIGGAQLYEQDHFAAAGLRLSFLRTTIAQHELDSSSLYLSIIHGLMHQGAASVANLLDSYDILTTG